MVFHEPLSADFAPWTRRVDDQVTFNAIADHPEQEGMVQLTHDDIRQAYRAIVLLDSVIHCRLHVWDASREDNYRVVILPSDTLTFYKLRSVDVVDNKKGPTFR